MTKIYRVTLFGVDNKGEFQYKRNRFFMTRELAVRYLREMNESDIEQAHGQYPTRDWYLHLIEYTENEEGELTYSDSAVYSHFLADADGYVARGERKCFETECPIFKTA